MSNGAPTFGNPSATAQRRMQVRHHSIPSFPLPTSFDVRMHQKELKEWLSNPPEGCSLQSSEPLHEWMVRMEGPTSGGDRESIYAGELYTLRIRFTDRYPIESPEVRQSINDDRRCVQGRRCRSCLCTTAQHIHTSTRTDTFVWTFCMIVGTEDGLRP